MNSLLKFFLKFLSKVPNNFFFFKFLINFFNISTTEIFNMEFIFSDFLLVAMTTKNIFLKIVIWYYLIDHEQRMLSKNTTLVKSSILQRGPDCQK